MEKARFEIQIDDAANCIFIRHFGVLDLPIILERGEAILMHKDYRSGLNRITDFTNAKVVMNSEDVRILTEKVSARGPGTGNFKEAFIVDSLIVVGLLRVFHSLSAENSNEYDIFSTENPDIQGKVKSWLGLDSGYKFPDFLSLK
ncbi:MAG: hypothetical protein JKY12_00980 [Sneathiella sp.]|nr:hypothetical protein [Sneathiella sp.]